MKRQHSQDILDKLEACSKNKQDIGVDYKKLCEDGFDANSGTYNANAYVQLDNNK